MKLHASILSIFLTLNLYAGDTQQTASDVKLKNLYNSLDPTSIGQHLAFYELYQSKPIAQKALNDAYLLLSQRQEMHLELGFQELLFPTVNQSLAFLCNKQADRDIILEDDESINFCLKIAEKLPHYKLKGHHVWTEQEVLDLALEEIDLSRGLLLTQFGDDRKRILSYEAMIDLMSLQILARLKDDASPIEKICKINEFLFNERGFRFPPHSLSTSAIDTYSFLPSVLDSHKGVCLGVSILYLCIAQRLQLPLEMITPPGHIYIRYRQGNQIINIETTARGIHLDCKRYLTVNVHSLQERNMREVIGMTHFNQASVFWQNEQFDEVVKAYRRAEPYMKDDPVLQELLGYALIATGEKKAGEEKLQTAKKKPPKHAIKSSSMLDDYLQGYVSIEAIAFIFSKDEDERSCLLRRKEKLEEFCKLYPLFRAGWLNLAMTWMQLHRSSECQNVLQYCATLDQSDPEVFYYLAILHVQRHDYREAWKSLNKAEKIVQAHSYSPDELKELRLELLKICYPMV